VYFRLLKVFHILHHGWCKYALEGKSKPSRKHTAIYLEKQIRMIHKFEVGQSSSAISRELGFMLLTVNTIMKYDAGKREHVKESQ
jgi:hypothetical protein